MRPRRRVTGALPPGPALLRAGVLVPISFASILFCFVFLCLFLVILLIKMAQRVARTSRVAFLRARGRVRRTSFPPAPDVALLAELDVTEPTIHIQ